MSFTKNLLHIVFTPKNRANVISINRERDVYSILVSILRKYGVHVHRVGGMADHIHILIDLPPTIAVSGLMQSLKRESSLIIAHENILPGWNGWQAGYAAMSVSHFDYDKVKNYIANQKAHHMHKAFYDEYCEWLVDNGISPDDPYFPKE